MRVDPQLEQVIDFSHPVYASGFGLAVHAQNDNQWWIVAGAIFSGRFISVLALLILLIFLVGLAIWFFERRKNTNQFGPGSRGIGSGFWWAAVTMTTVGYGDKSPESSTGRAVALIWMFSSIFLISAFTAAITTTLHIARETPRIQSTSDLGKVSVGVVQKTFAANYLDKQGIGFKSYSSTSEALKKLGQGEVDVVFGELPRLHYYLRLRSDKPELKLLNTTFNRFHYAIAIPQGEPMREEINVVLLQKLAQPQWQYRLEKYAGN